MWSILIKGKEPLGGMMLSLLDIWFMNNYNLDVTNRDFDLLDMDADYKLDKKRAKYLSMSMLEKIESGLMDESYEGQEEFYTDLYFDNDNVTPNIAIEVVKQQPQHYERSSNYPDTVSLFPIESDLGDAIENYEDEEGFRDSRADWL
jgi:hypothetical protein